MKEISDEGIRLNDGNREGEREGKGKGAWREEVGKAIEGRKSGYEVKR